MSEIAEKVFTGNNLEVHLAGGDPKTKYLVTGNFCNVEINVNVTTMKLVGNSNRLKVKSGRGTVSYIGNDGTLELPADMDSSLVSYIGDNPHISYGAT